ncbi:MAG: DUF3795 domain-containing protein [Spirochaetes bacterium]|nr:DUF3795 domain-containing protein [Spirochaetota bacterium]
MYNIAPCGIICDICFGFQRDKNKCVGCNNDGFKPGHCNDCRIKLCCEEKVKVKEKFCIYCNDFPCRLIKHLDDRYRTKYNESPVQNLISISGDGLEKFIKTEKEKWTCTQCGKLLCVHRDNCMNCGAANKYFISHRGNKKHKNS